MTASRGRGKSATLGLALAASVAFGYVSMCQGSFQVELCGNTGTPIYLWRVPVQKICVHSLSFYSKDLMPWSIRNMSTTKWYKALTLISTMLLSESISSTNTDRPFRCVLPRSYEDVTSIISHAQYIHPTDAYKCEQAELMCIDEAAAIPLPLVKQLMGPYLILMASTING